MDYEEVVRYQDTRYSAEAEPGTAVDRRLALIQAAQLVDAERVYPKLRALLLKQQLDRKVTGALHVFRNADLRVHDNRALAEAGDLAQRHGVPLVCLYVYCPQDRHWELCKPPRANFQRGCVEALQAELLDRNIPLIYATAEVMTDYGSTVLQTARDCSASHIYANYEYELERLYRDLDLASQCRKGGRLLILRHDQTVVEPLTICSAGGKPMRVFTPYHAVWCAKIAKTPALLDTVEPPQGNAPAALSSLEPAILDQADFPPLPALQEYDDEAVAARMLELWPYGRAGALRQLERFVAQHLANYAETRSNAALDSSSRLSPYFSAGAISVREVLQRAAVENRGSYDFSVKGARAGVFGWVREIVFRETYKQRLLDIPHLGLAVPENLKFAHVNWLEDDEAYERWEKGLLGVPFVDAGMRQINAEAWMHNRLRLNVASYLKCNLCLDYRRGEEFFAHTLMDYDLSNNAQGWEPSFTVFNPVLQAEKNDPDGDFIRQWLPELRGVKGKAIFDPYNRLPREEFEKLGYPKPYKEFRESKAEALDKFAKAMQAGAGPGDKRQTAKRTY